MIGNTADQGSGDKRLLLTVPEAARLLRISRNLAYELIVQGRLPHVRFGRVIRIPRSRLEEWILEEALLPKGTAKW